jgi:hypothetical protein
MTAMSFEDLEQVYERLAQAIDQAGRANEALLLSKLVLLLARRQGDLPGFEESVTAALADLPARSNG